MNHFPCDDLEHRMKSQMHFLGAMLANIRQTDVFDKNNLLDAYFDWFGNEMTLVTVKQLETDQNADLRETKVLDMIHVYQNRQQKVWYVGEKF